MEQLVYNFFLKLQRDIKKEKKLYEQEQKKTLKKEEKHGL
jgi:hypothetical protein